MWRILDFLLYPFHTTGGIACGRPRLGNVPVIGSPCGVSIQPCESVANRPLPCESHGSFKLFKISASDFGTVTEHAQMILTSDYGNRRCGPRCT